MGASRTIRGRTSPQLTENDISAGLYPDTQFTEQPRQERVVGLVVDDEAGVEREALVVDGADVATCRALALEDGDIVARASRTCAAPRPLTPAPITAIRIEC